LDYAKLLRDIKQYVDKVNPQRKKVETTFERLTRLKKLLQDEAQHAQRIQEGNIQSTADDNVEEKALREMQEKISVLTIQAHLLRITNQNLDNKAKKILIG
jgi:hypothetical protein